VREILETSIDKEKIVADVLQNFGTVIDGPIPTSLQSEEVLFGNAASTPQYSSEEALRLIGEADFDTNTEGVLEDSNGQRLQFILATADVPELIQVAQQLEKQWKELGIAVTVDVFSTRDFTQNIIRSRSYDAILFGEVIGRDIDLYPFWHSSQRNDPGLNIANYANIDADAALEEARTQTDEALKMETLKIATREIANDTPALFLYNPEYIYVTSDTIKGIASQTLMTGSERFVTVHEWYKDTDRVWNFFNI